MSDWPSVAPALSDLVADSGIPYPNGVPYSHITFTMVVWNDEERARALLKYIRPFFEEVVVGVQESPDGTLEVAREYADRVVQDEHRGFGDATFGPLVLPRVRTHWVLKCDADEWPSEDLLYSLSNATWYADNVVHVRGVWIPFRSSVDGISYEERHSHMRLFWGSEGWPDTLHSTPPIAYDQSIFWDHGYISHDRSLDELVIDYMRYLEIGKENEGWTAHNEMMIRNACIGTATVKGWDYVKSHEWWPQVEAIVDKES